MPVRSEIDKSLILWRVSLLKGEARDEGFDTVTEYCRCLLDESSEYHAGPLTKRAATYWLLRYPRKTGGRK